MLVTSIRPKPLNLEAPLADQLLTALCALTGARFGAITQWVDGEWWMHEVRNDLGLPVQAGSTLDRGRVELVAISTRLDTLKLDSERLSPSTIQVSKDHVDLAKDLNQGNEDGIQASGPTHFYGYPIYTNEGAFLGALVALDSARSLNDFDGLEETVSTFANLIGASASSADNPRTQSDSTVVTPSDASGSPFETSVGEVSRSAAASAEWSFAADGQSVIPHPSPAAARVLGVMGHDLRNPLHSLLAAIEMLKSKPLDPRAQRLAGMVEGSAQRLGELAQANLDFARQQLVGDISLQIEPVTDLQSRLQKVVDSITPSYPQRSFNIALTGCERVLCDAQKLSQAFASVLVHGIRHASLEGDISVHSVLDAKHAFVLSVQVPGYIVAPELVDHIFDPFYYADGEAKVAPYGIGLYLAQAIATGHGGSLSLVRDVSGDATFSISIPQ